MDTDPGIFGADRSMLVALLGELDRIALTVFAKWRNLDDFDIMINTLVGQPTLLGSCGVGRIPEAALDDDAFEVVGALLRSGWRFDDDTLVPLCVRTTIAVRRSDYSAHALATAMIRGPRLRPVVFIDLDASGLDKGPCAIEIGAAWISDGEVRMRSSLIRPRPEWPASAWSAESAAIHGVAPDALSSAPTADHVAYDVRHLLGGATILSDSPTHDQMWLDRLLGRPGPRVEDFHLAAHERFGANADALKALNDNLARTPAFHRAGPDAQRLANAWREAGRRMR
jgi:hypothetical protein